MPGYVIYSTFVRVLVCLIAVDIRVVETDSLVRTQKLLIEFCTAASEVL